jgi:4-hydroxy-tetrahydrodipicolinate synthase
MASRPLWHGVYPAATTQFDASYEVDLDATSAVQDALIADGVDGLIVLGTCGENNSLEPGEKEAVLERAVATSARRVPIVAGVSELSTARALNFAKRAQAIGVDALMVLPAMVYVPSPAELVQHLRMVAEAVDLPIMLYNNPPAYRTSLDFESLAELAQIPNIRAVKESAPDSRRFTDMFNRFGDRFVLLAGLDDVAFEGLVLGAAGWVSGLTSAFPAESLALFAALECGDLDTARAIYRWFMPLLHLDAEHDLVQSIKLAEQMVGRGSERVRMPRMPLAGARRAQVIAFVEEALATRPSLK